MRRCTHSLIHLGLLWWCLFVTLALPVIVTADDLGEDQVEQQSGADRINDNEFLWFTAILRLGKLRCGGSWIGGRFVLTAAHCVDGVERSIFADVGYFCDSRDNCGRPHQVVNVANVDYLTSPNADFALLTLEVAPCPDIIKADPAIPDLEGTYLKRLRKKNPEMVLVGGGRTENGGGPSNVVQKLVVDFVTPKSCRKMGIAKAKNGFICSIPRKGVTSGPCAGDSGGPLVVPGRNKADKGRDVVVAVHSFGRRVCGAVRQKPDGHFSVSRAETLIRTKVCVLDAATTVAPDWCGMAQPSPTVAPTTTTTTLSPVAAVTGPVQGEEISSLAFSDGFLDSVAFNPTGRDNQIATGGVFGARVWDSTNLDKTQVYTFVFGEVHTGFVTSVAYSSDGSLLASASDDSTVKIWDPVILNGKPNLQTLSGAHTGIVYQASFDPTNANRLASASADTTAILWNVQDASVIRTFAGGHGESAVRAVCFSPDGSVLATGGDDGNIVLWTVEDDASFFALPSAHAGRIYDLAWSPDGKRLASASADRTVRIWDTTSQTLSLTFGILAFFNGHGSDVFSVSWHPNSRYVASSARDGYLKIWNAVEGGPALLTVGDSGDAMSGVSWSPDGRVIAGAKRNERSVVLYEITNLP